MTEGVLVEQGIKGRAGRGNAPDPYLGSAGSESVAVIECHSGCQL